MQHGVELRSRRYALAALERNGEVLTNRSALFVRECARAVIEHPTVNASAPRIDEHEVLVAELFFQHVLQHLRGDTHQRPAECAHGCSALFALAAAHVVVVRHVNVKHQLFLLGHHRGLVLFGLREGGEGQYARVYNDLKGERRTATL